MNNKEQIDRIIKKSDELGVIDFHIDGGSLDDLEIGLAKVEEIINTNEAVKKFLEKAKANEKD